MKFLIVIATAAAGLVASGAAQAQSVYIERAPGPMVYGYTEYAPGYETEGYVVYERRQPRRYQDPGAYGLKDRSNPNASLRTEADREVFWDSTKR
jgi:hypothetical protein